MVGRAAMLPSRRPSRSNRDPVQREIPRSRHRQGASITEYRPFLEPMPAYGNTAYGNAWFERYEWADDPVVTAMASALLTVQVLLGGPLAGVVVGAIARMFGVRFGSVFEVVWMISLCFAVLCALVAVGLLVYRITVFPGLERQREQRFEQAVAAWRQRRLAHITEWEQRLGWPPA